MNNLDSSALYSLQQLEQNGTGRSASLARSLLRLNGIETDYEPPRYLPEGTVAYKSAMIKNNRPAKSPTSFKLYPNPADDHVILQWDWFKEALTGPITVRLSDIQGRVLKEVNLEDFQKNTLLLDVESLTAGVYLLEVIHVEDRVYVERLVRK